MLIDRSNRHEKGLKDRIIKVELFQSWKRGYEVPDIIRYGALLRAVKFGTDILSVSLYSDYHIS